MKHSSLHSRDVVHHGAHVSERPVNRSRWLLLCLLVTFGAVSASGATPSPESDLERGYWQMYNLQFSGAHKTFHAWEQTHAADPLGPTSDAAACLFSEFDRLGILRADLFVNDLKFKDRPAEHPDSAVRRSFVEAIAKSNRLAAAALAKSPRDTNALFAMVMNQGLQADYLALIEKRDLGSVSSMKRGGLLADELLKIDPTCYDAYLAVGMENYILGLRAAPVRWLLRLYGAQTDETVGLQKLRLTAEKGRLLRPFARLLLAVAALREHRRERAKQLLQGLAQEFPNNSLYRQELAKLQ